MFIDDERFPSETSEKDFLVVRSSNEAIASIVLLGCPSFISFDHDLGGDDTAMIVVYWMIEQDLDAREKGQKFFADNFDFTVHSQNPIGAKNIKETLNSYLRFRNSENGNLCV